jgi:hypothetical protein
VELRALEVDAPMAAGIENVRPIALGALTMAASKSKSSKTVTTANRDIFNALIKKAKPVAVPLSLRP